MYTSDEEDSEVKGGALPAEEEKNKTALAIKTGSQALVDKSKEDERRKSIMKDKRAQQIALDVAAKIVKEQLLEGNTEEEAIQKAQEAIDRVFREYKPSVSVEKGVEQACKVIEEWVERENIKNNVFTCELEINDYPTISRSKVIKKDFLNSFIDFGCTVTVRGTFVEPNKRIPPGQKKLHLYIQGNSKNEVLRCYKDIKQTLDDSALEFYTRGTPGYGGNVGKYHI
jgi:hypothetical protein